MLSLRALDRFNAAVTIHDSGSLLGKRRFVIVRECRHLHHVLLALSEQHRTGVTSIRAVDPVAIEKNDGAGGPTQGAVVGFSEEAVVNLCEAVFKVMADTFTDLWSVLDL